MNEQPPFSRLYAVLGGIILMMPLFMMAENNVPAWVLHLTMAVALLGTGRLFYTKLARTVWIISLTMNVFRLVLAGVLLLRF